jgi:hypothetical protein
MNYQEFTAIILKASAEEPAIMPRFIVGGAK